MIKPKFFVPHNACCLAGFSISLLLLSWIIHNADFVIWWLSMSLVIGIWCAGLFSFGVAYADVEQLRSLWLAGFSGCLLPLILSLAGWLFKAYWPGMNGEGNGSMEASTQYLFYAFGMVFLTTFIPWALGFINGYRQRFS